MSEKMTLIDLRDRSVWSGIGEWGECSAAKMIERARGYAQHLRAQADLIDAAADEDFHIRIVRGRIVQHPVRTVQEGRVPPTLTEGK